MMKLPESNTLKERLIENGALISMIILFIAAAALYRNFLQYRNLTNILRQVSMLGLVGFGMTFVILIGGIDLSVGSIVGLSAVLTAYFTRYGILPAVAVPLAVGLLIGLINGALVTFARIVPFIGTLVMMIALRGVIYIFTDMTTITVDKALDSFKFLGRGYLLYLPVPAWIMIIAAFIFSYILKYTSFGRAVYALGGNEEAAGMMGLKVTKIKIVCYILNGGLAALAGCILASRLGAGQFVAGTGWELDAIAAVVVGGTLLTGGQGKIVNTFIGVLIFGLITNIINLNGSINSWWQVIITGLLLLFVVILQSRKYMKSED